MEIIYGYCRISTPSQSIERQERNIKEAYPDAIIVREVYSGRKEGRPEWKKLYENIKRNKNDRFTIVFDEVSRMSRDAEEGVKMYFDLFDRGVELCFLKEPFIDTSMYRKNLEDKVALMGTDEDIIFKGVNDYFRKLAENQIRSAFEASQRDVDYLSQRTKEGIETARLNGKQIGSKPGSVYKIKVKDAIKDIIRKKSNQFEGSNNDSEVIAIINTTKYLDDKKIERTYHVASNTYYKYKRELKENN